VPAGPNDDVDADGYSPADGDCNDCEPRVGPNNVEIPGNGFDEDCDGMLDNALEPCDGGIAIDESDAVEVLRAIELCKMSSGPEDWGVVSAAWVLADGSPPPADPTQNADFHLGHGVLDDFGPNVSPRAGGRLLALSNDDARRPGDPGARDSWDKNYTSNLPAGFPKDSATCPGTFTNGPAEDPIGLEAQVRAPSNATGISFELDAYAADFPQFICSTYDDAFAALLTPTPMGLPDANVVFDAAGEIFSVNGARYEVCGCDGGPPCQAGGKSFACSLGTDMLEGTGFEGNAATGWNLTTVPIVGGEELTIRFVVWDLADGVVTSTVLLDSWRWLTDPVVDLKTTPVP
jgi:hypothetical protein